MAMSHQAPCLRVVRCGTKMRSINPARGRGQRLYLQGPSLCGQCASSTGGQPDAENRKLNPGHSQ
ncbi:hypothetical protein NQZ68_029526, partial [Dissostichus eleginoides]